MSGPGEFSHGPKVFEFQCSQCGEHHAGSPSFASDKPFHYFAVPEKERDDLIELTTDTCIIRPSQSYPDATYLIRCMLEIPIHGAAEPFCWGVWVTQSEASFTRYVRTFGDDQSGDGSFGWLPVTMAYYLTNSDDNPVHLECNVSWGAMHRRPSITLNPSDHPLYIHQRDGISWDTAIEIAQVSLHGDN